MTMRISPALVSLVASAMLASCSVRLPQDAMAENHEPSIYPDYSSVTIPVNIAPLNFEILESADKYVTHLHTRADGEGIVVGGKIVDVDTGKWHSLLETALGDTLLVDIYCRRQGVWHKYRSVANPVAEEIDPYVAYRLIEPSYIAFENMLICQRDLRNFSEREIFNNYARSTEQDGQCINCHSFQSHNLTGRYQMHLRQNEGGTLIAMNDTIRKVDLMTEATISSGVYPSWHPELPLIAYSVNSTSQKFHTRDVNKVEVQDFDSNLILYDAVANTVTPLLTDDGVMETFPSWSPDGRWLYYVAYRLPDSIRGDDNVNAYMALHYKDVKYDIMRRPFDCSTRRVGQADTVFMASDLGRSATLPRVSPDGQLLMFTMAEYGTFHIWHRDADLYTLNLTDGSVHPLTEANSDDVESYHSWSSDGRWVIFSSRRDDGSYTRLYIAYIDTDGRAHKPFLLPQRKPSHNLSRMKSYNIPEFMAAPMQQSRLQLLDAARRTPQPATLLP